MPRTLVTGATGFVGSNLVKLLRRRDWQVRCLVRDVSRARSLEEAGAELAVGSLNDADSIDHAVADTDVVFHLAGRVRALRSREFAEDNIEGTQRVVEACAAQQSPPVMVFVSSIAAAGPSSPGTPHCESDPDQPVSDYGRSKLAAERALIAHAGEVPLSIVRPPIVFGPGDKASLAIFRGVKITHIHLVPGYRAFPVSVIHVADLCDAIVRIAEQGKRITSAQQDSQGVYYVTAERSLKYGEFGKLVAQAIGCSAISLPLPKALFWLVGGTAELLGQALRRPAILGLDKIREAVAPGWECSDEKIRRELNYQPERSLEERFAETAAWYRQHDWL